MPATNFSQWRNTGKCFKYRGHSIFYKDEGNGPALLCIHGFPTASWDWHRVWPALKNSWRVIAPDLIGFGFSEKPRWYAYSLFDQADLIEALLKELGVAEVHILAHDYGVSVTQELLARYYERQDQLLSLRSVCFLNGGLFPETHRPRFMQKLLLTPIGPLVSRFMSEQRFNHSFSEVFAPAKQPSKKDLKEFWQLVNNFEGRKVMARLIGYITERTKNRERWVGALQRTSIPLRLINGALDPISGRHMADRYTELVPKSDVVSLEDCGHYPQLEYPTGMLRAFKAFTKHLIKEPLPRSVAP